MNASRITERIETINRHLSPLLSVGDALKQARALGAFNLQGVVFYHNKLCPVSELVKIKRLKAR